MPFQATRQTAHGVEIITLADGQGSHVEICPALGFNAYRWHAAGHELLHADPGFFAEGRPTRSGIPILFPFPNRIRAGRYSWAGKPFQLPTIDPAGKNAIHGFACRSPWRVVEEASDGVSAWATGEFQGSRDAPESLALWPTDYRVRVTYRLLLNRLRVEAVVDNPSAEPLPFGLGYHPYFRVAPFGGEEAVVSAVAEGYWELDENLPTGVAKPTDDARELRGGQALAGLRLDDVLTGLRPDPTGTVASIRHPGGRPALTLRASPDFRELVVFTPPHRQAFCIEPYTCTTDAINLQQAGVDAGWRVLPAGEEWRGDVEVAIAI